MTVKVYELPSNTSSRKAKQFLDENGIAYTVQNMAQETLSWKQLLEILSHTEDGVEEIISTRSLDYKRLTKQGVDFEELSLKQLHKLILEYPKLVRAPIMVTEKLTLVGYNDEEIQSLLNREDKKKEFRKVLDRIRAIEDRELIEVKKFRMTKHDMAIGAFERAI